MRHYETTWIMRPSLGEAQFAEIIDRTAAIITGDSGTVIDIGRWGIKKLAYEIKKESQGCYVCMNYAAPGKTIKELERIFRIDDRILRYLTVKLADTIDAAGIELEKERIAALAAKAAEVAAALESGVEAEQDAADELA
ncbi:MAG: 30S ribosomal protein S6 [Candidatus Electronema sp. V4]|uniref:30S ribosomal protein S6 n=1 Tax=Candidatus Electronema sp. V4 TaxID=3454756 RepID=UPI0040557E77